MLDLIRRRAQGIVAWIIIILIIIPFALWGIQKYTGGGKAQPAATVDGINISQSELHTAYLNQRQRLQQMLGKNFRPDMYPEAVMKPRILQQLIERAVLVNAAADMGMAISDQELAQTIRSIQAFQVDGKFSPQRYRDLLSRQGMSASGFEAQVRRDLVVEQLQNAVSDSEFVTKGEKLDHYRLAHQKRDIGVMVLPLKGFLEKAKVSDSEISQYYDKHKNEFIRPEQVKLAYLELSVDALAQGEKVTDQEVKAYYDAHRSNFATPEERRARHILFAAKPGDPEAEKKALEAAREARKKILSGKITFAQAAKELSDDTGSAKKGGDLGYFGRGVMVPAFEKAAFSLKKGQISEPVRTQYGYHLITLEGVRGGKVKPLDEVKGQIRDQIRHEKAQKAFYSTAESLANLTYEHPESLQLAADELGLKINETGYFSRQGKRTGLAANPKVVEAAFSPDVLDRGNNSQAIELGQDHLVVVRAADRRPQMQLPLKDVKDRIAQHQKEQKARDAAQAAAEEAVKNLQTGSDPESVAKTRGVEWKRYDDITRDATKPQSAVVGAAFRMSKPEKGKVHWKDLALASGGEAVIGLYAVQEPNLKGKEAAADVPQFEQAEQQAALDAFINSLRQGADIQIHRRGKEQ